MFHLIVSQSNSFESQSLTKLEDRLEVRNLQQSSCQSTSQQYSYKCIIMPRFLLTHGWWQFKLRPFCLCCEESYLLIGLLSIIIRDLAFFFVILNFYILEVKNRFKGNKRLFFIKSRFQERIVNILKILTSLLLGFEQFKIMLSPWVCSLIYKGFTQKAADNWNSRNSEL